MNDKHNHQYSASSKKVEDSLPNYLLFFSCALQLACFGCSIYSLYTLAYFFAQVASEPAFRLGLLR